MHVLENIKEPLQDHSKYNGLNCLWTNLHLKIDLIGSGKCNIISQRFVNKEAGPQVVTKQTTIMTKSQAVINAETLAFKRLDARICIY